MPRKPWKGVSKMEGSKDLKLNLKAALKLELGLNGRDTSYLKNTTNMLVVSKVVKRLVDEALFEIFTEGL